MATGPILTRRAFAGAGAMALAVPARAMQATAPVLAAGQDARVTVDPAAKAVRFDRMIFGQFLEHFHRQVYGGAFDPGSPLADRAGFRMDVIEALRELRIPIVRWPGGCFVSAYHWQDGVGAARTPAFDKAWGVEDPNTFGTDEFVAWCRLIGAEPYICTNAGTGTFEEMSDWVEYCNLKDQGKFARMRRRNGHAEPFGVKYWSIGNENYFSTELGSKTIDEWGMLVRESAKLMRAVDRDLILLAAATVDPAWTNPLLKVAGGYLNYISIHGYWDALWEKGTTPSSYIECMMRSRQPEEQIEGASKVLADAGFAGKIRIAFDEWNLRSWHHPGFPGGGADRVDLIRERDENDFNQTYTMADALFSAAFLNGCLRHADEVRMACMAPVVNVRGPLFAHGKGIVRRTTFHVLRMYSDLLQPNVMACRIDSAPLTSGNASVPQVDLVATCSDDRRKTAIALINRHPTKAARVRVDGLPVRGGRLTLLDGTSPDACNDIAHPSRVAPRQRDIRGIDGVVEVPAHALAILESDAMTSRSILMAAAASLATMATVIPAAAQDAASQAAGPGIIDKRGVLARATWLDNRDTDWYLANAPFVDTPDKVIDDTFLYRIELMTKHFVYGSPEDGYSVTEFIDRPGWSGTYGAISAPLGLQFADLRWLRDRRVTRDYAKYWMHVEGAQPRSYSNWFGSAMWGLHKAWGDKAFIVSMLPDMKAQYAGFAEEHWDKRYGMFVWDGMHDGMETNINSRQTDNWFSGAPGVRPTFSSYMYGDARAIADTARLAGDAATAKTFDANAAAIKAGVQKMLWDPKRRFFFHMFANDEKLPEKLPEGFRPVPVKAGTLTYQSGPFAGDPHGRELIGYVPWQFGLPDVLPVFSSMLSESFPAL